MINYHYHLDALSVLDGPEPDLRNGYTTIEEVVNKNAAKLISASGHPIGDCWLFVTDKELHTLPSFITRVQPPQ